MEGNEIKVAVKERYAEVARGVATCGSLCGCTDNAEGLAITFGYSADELATLPDGANLGLSCGNPQAVAAMQPGEAVLDLGSAWEAEPTAAVRQDLEALVGCIGGALVLDDYLSRLRRAGFARVEVERHPEAARKMAELAGIVPPPGSEQLLSVNITAIK